MESRDEALLRPGVPVKVLLSAKRAHYGHTERPREHHTGYKLCVTARHPLAEHMLSAHPYGEYLETAVECTVII